MVNNNQALSTLHLELPLLPYYLLLDSSFLSPLSPFCHANTAGLGWRSRQKEADTSERTSFMYFYLKQKVKT
jgi:hypothetical protein